MSVSPGIPLVGLEDLGQVMDTGPAHGCDPSQTWSCCGGLCQQRLVVPASLAPLGAGPMGPAQGPGTWTPSPTGFFPCTGLYTHSAVHPSPPSNSGPFVTPKETLYPLSSPSHPHPSPWQAAVCFPSPDVPVLGISCTWSHMLCGLCVSFSH